LALSEQSVPSPWSSPSATAITDALDAFERTVVTDPRLVHALRAVRRSTAAVGRRVAAGD
jgi:hypothetical protein